MQFSFLGFSVKKVMEFELDVKDLAILRFFQDFMKSGKMNYEEVDGVKYYWISYKNISEEMPFLGLGKRTIMMRMFKLRDLGLLSHYTKKEGGTFSYYTLGVKFNELLYTSENRSLSNIENESKNSSRNLNGQFINEIKSNNKGDIIRQASGESNANIIAGVVGEEASKINSIIRQAVSEMHSNNIKGRFGHESSKENSTNVLTTSNEDSNIKENIISDDLNSQKTNRGERLEGRQSSIEESERSLQVNFEELIKSIEDNTDRHESKIREELDYGQAGLVVNNNSINGQETLSEKNTSKTGQAVLDKSINQNQTLGQAESNKSIKEKQTLVQDKLIEINKDSINHKEEDKSILGDRNQNNKDTLSKDMNRGCSSNDTTKTNLLNYLTTKNTNDLKSIKDKLEFILNYLNIKANVNYRITNRRTVGLITARLREGFTPEDFKVVIDKKISEWSGTNFEQYLNPFTLFGDKFELYLNQKVASKKSNANGGVSNSKSEKFYKSDARMLRFHNFTGREVDYDSIEKQLLGWD
ncbi:conserved phage C-terminal domain-containing protein [Clostridium sp.]|uniref:conserved phage C-terminal domain-containing protein n=1 Tax=Clostridium sp. TaxID=1506 RepID=UPI001D71E2A4|nr:conserved phage C-terminal domain-containing protein [Clostridium sp.]MBS5937922.1 conserved phage C-terminal domain-containing protein [Clostridium sp.]